MRGSFGLLAVAMILSGCARITAVPLEPDGLTAIPGAVQGIRYWLPRPYLQVMAIPPAPLPGSGDDATGAGQPRPGHIAHGHAGRPGGDSAPQPAPPPDGPPAPGAAAPANAGGQSAANQGGSKDTSAQQATSAPGSTGETGFSAASATYQAKLVYLPDLSQPMALTMTTGPFGTASMQVTLQDGWMLTNLSMNADSSQNATLVTSAFQALAGGMTGGASTAVSGTTAKKPTAPPPSGATDGAPTLAPAVADVLAPGLYAFDYTPGMSRITSVCAIAYYGPDGAVSAAAPGMKGACGKQEPRPLRFKPIPAF